MMLRCQECHCVSDAAQGWVGFLSRDPDDPDDPAVVVLYCPPCSNREFSVQQRAASTYT